MINVILTAILAAFVFIGCAGDTIQVSKCKSYKDGICVNKDVRDVKLCVNPLKIDGKTYCEVK